jgi:hypothetical protein
MMASGIIRINPIYAYIYMYIYIYIYISDQIVCSVEHKAKNINSVVQQYSLIHVDICINTYP